ncbi:MAG: PIN domain-containing protein [Gammaproteobacteria bacterium]|jgi:predicted nucleic acid-binding protein|nr:PIN domain-containing protein [Gammaproteobacteria bacterium]
MSGERFTLDTNVLVYAVDADAGGRHAQARELVDRAVEVDCVLTLQALGEFFHAVTRKGRMPAADAADQVRDWQSLFPVVAARTEDLDRAVTAVLRHGLSFWDAMLWATAKAAGVTVLLSEDFQHDRVLEGIRFRDPFVAADPLAESR